ncbi:MAG TPA: uroporphyrinogen-III C-methyltransferase [Vicinamibacterales bacterium]|nr:uroporphyrinogen-III C-methyltransferase [Acidobacteriota bacterium]HOC17336.1 uroporphyrinogen-III C-methyltransferase [Vicinamibacterales bacterium]
MSGGDGSNVGTVYLVGAGPGDPRLLTLRGLELLRGADTVVFDALVDRALLEHCRPGVRLFVAGQRDDPHVLAQDAINRLIVEEARAGRTVVRLKGGDPFVFGRGGEEAEVLAAAGVRYEIVPGVSAGTAVPACAGIPATHRGYTSELVFLTGQQCESKPTPVNWSLYGPSSATLVIFMGIASLADVAGSLLAHGRSPSCPAAVIENGSTTAQRTITAPLSRIADEAATAGIQAPAIVVIGEVVGLRDRLKWFPEG